jgi:hypothetical protein
MKISRFILTTFSIISLIACKETEIPKASIDPAFTSYYNKFLEEGNKRGVTFTPEQQAITMRFSEQPKKNGFGRIINIYFFIFKQILTHEKINDEIFKCSTLKRTNENHKRWVRWDCI